MNNPNVAADLGLHNPTRRKLLYAAVAGGAGLIGAALAWWRQSGEPELGEVIPKEVWQQNLDTPGGGKLRLASFQGKPLVINFWATWCPPCVEEMPLLDRFYRENSAKNWNVIGLAVDRPESVRHFLAQHPVAFPIGLVSFEGFDLGRLLGNVSGSLPFTVVVDATGVVAQRKMGRLATADIEAWARLNISI